MRKVVWAVGGSFTRKTLPVSLQWFYPGLSERSITTNSAINRGIRRGKIEHFRPDMLEVANSYSKANSYGKRGDQGLERKSFIRLDKARRPNHQQQQDVEDQEALAMIKESRQTPGQKRYPRAGREEPAVQRRQEKPTYSPRQYKEGRWATSSYDRERRETRSRSQNYSPSTSPRPDRMSGREAYPDRLQKSADPKTDRTSRQSRAPDSEDEASGFASQVRQPRASKEALPIPYTTPASEFLYGTSVIIAALKSRRRKMYKLYVYEGDNREALPRDASVLKLALAAGVPVTPVKGDELRLMDKMSTGRPHNVCIHCVPLKP